MLFALFPHALGHGPTPPLARPRTVATVPCFGPFHATLHLAGPLHQPRSQRSLLNGYFFNFFNFHTLKRRELLPAISFLKQTAATIGTDYKLGSPASRSGGRAR